MINIGKKLNHTLCRSASAKKKTRQISGVFKGRILRVVKSMDVHTENLWRKSFWSRQLHTVPLDGIGKREPVFVPCLLLLQRFAIFGKLNQGSSRATEGQQFFSADFFENSGVSKQHIWTQHALRIISWVEASLKMCLLTCRNSAVRASLFLHYRLPRVHFKSFWTPDLN